MRKKNPTIIIAVVLAATLLANCFIVTVISPQPPIIADTYYLQRINHPIWLDPARAWDEASREVIQNIYQTLIWWNDKHPIIFTSGIGHNLTTAEYSDLNSYEPVLCTEVPTMANGRVVTNASGSYWRFTINTNAQFQPWIDHKEVTQPSRNITADDVVYSFRREVIYDSPYGPAWMWMSSAFGTVSWSTMYQGLYDTYTNGTFNHVANELAAAIKILSWCYSIGDDVYFHFQRPWPEDVQRQLFAQTWGAVINPDFVKEHGGWDGLFTTGISDLDMTDGWTNNYHWKPKSSESELDMYKSPVTFPGHGSAYDSHFPETCGSGPYMLTFWTMEASADYVGYVGQWQIDYNPAYWRGWEHAGDKAGNFIKTVIEKGEYFWPTTKMMFLDGDFDEVEVPRPNMYDLLTSTYNPIAGISLVYNIIPLRNEAIILNTNVSLASPWQSYAGYPSHLGLPTNLFANEHFRKAFAWALNYTEYIQRAYAGEAIKQTSWTTDDPMLQRDLNYVEMQNELNQVVINGVNISLVGFDTILFYTLGNLERKIAVEMIAAAFQKLSTKYHVSVDIGWLPSTWLNRFMDDMVMPGYTQGKLADFVDQLNFPMAYMYSGISFSNMQGPPFPTDQTTIDAQLSSGTLNIAQLQAMYFNDVMSFGLVKPFDRRWTRDWVQNWTCNQLLPGDYFYDLYKGTHTTESVDLRVKFFNNLSDFPVVMPCPQSGYLIIGNGNSAPASQIYSITVTRNDTNDAIPVLYTAVGLRISGPNGETYFADSHFTALMIGGSAALTLTWNGTDPGPVYGNSTGVRWQVSGETWPVNSDAQDSDPSGNSIFDGKVTVITLPADITNNGLVDIFDAILLANSFGASMGEAKWNRYADLNSNGTIDIFDAILLANSFNKHVP